MLRLALPQTPRGACLNGSITLISDSRHRFKLRFRHINIYDLSEISAMGATTQKTMRVAGWRDANVFSAALLSNAGNSADSCKSFISA
jgi:hypothetical protein